MKPKITFSIEDDLLMCYITGERSDDSAIELWAEMIDYCHHHDLSRVQVTLALRGKYQPFKAIEIYRSIIEMLQPVPLKLAVVDLNHLSASDSLVACNMALSKGINVGYFDSQAQAKSWLAEQSDDGIELNSQFNTQSNFRSNSLSSSQSESKSLSSIINSKSGSPSNPKKFI